MHKQHRATLLTADGVCSLHYINLNLLMRTQLLYLCVVRHLVFFYFINSLIHPAPSINAGIEFENHFFRMNRAYLRSDAFVHGLNQFMHDHLSI